MARPKNRDKIGTGKKKAIAARYGLTGVGETTAPCHYCGLAGRVLWAPARVDYDHWYRSVPERVHFHHEIDHVIPVCAGGTNDLVNLVLACEPCNRRKGTCIDDSWMSA